MISSIGKIALTGLACGALGLGLGGVWASQAGPAPSEPMRTLVHPGPAMPVLQAEASAGEAPPSPAPGDETTAPAGLSASPKAGPTSRVQPRSALGPRAPNTEEELRVKRLVVTDRIQEREPRAATELRADGSEVFAFVELSNGSGEAQRIEIVFEHESGQQVGFVKLPVPRDSSRWRTWGQTRQIKQEGRWVARVRSEDGTELMSQSFTVGQG